MRVSDAAIFDSNIAHVTRSRAELLKRQEQAVTGKRVLKPSDDPTATALARRERSREVRAKAHQRAVGAGLTTNEASDAALGQVGSVLRRVKELTIQAASDTLDASGRADIAREVEALREQVRSLANTEVAGQYVFAGFADGSAPFDASGAYLGDARVRQLEVARGIFVDAGVTGASAFGMGGGTDLFATLDALTTALDSNNVGTIRSSIDSLDVAYQQVSSSRAQLGANVNALETARGVAERVENRAITGQTDLVGVDTERAYTDLSRAQFALQAAVQVASQLPYAGLVQRG
ncbi:MAG: flagellar hook-associated protein 3 [Deltaproteobacteria bacterium]|nr:flagellar hook-associated protein 3 [Deltaproteobacteria bacterium]